MLILIDQTNHCAERFDVSHFERIIVDEAHSAVYNCYGANFTYFDALLRGA